MYPGAADWKLKMFLRHQLGAAFEECAHLSPRRCVRVAAHVLRPRERAARCDYGMIAAGCGLPYDPPVGVMPMQQGRISRFDRAVCGRFAGRAVRTVHVLSAPRMWTFPLTRSAYQIWHISIAFWPTSKYFASRPDKRSTSSSDATGITHCCNAGCRDAGVSAFLVSSCLLRQYGLLPSRL